MTLERVHLVKDLLKAVEKHEVVFQPEVGDPVVEDMVLVAQSLWATGAPQSVTWPLLLEEEPWLLEIQTSDQEVGWVPIADQERLLETVQQMKTLMHWVMHLNYSSFDEWLDEQVEGVGMMDRQQKSPW